MPQKNTKLAVAIFDSEFSQAYIERACKIPQGYISGCVNGWRILSDEHQQRIADFLKAERGELFS